MKHLLVFIFCLFLGVGYSQNPLSVIIKKTDTPIEVDGAINDSEWKNINMVSDFVSHQPYDTSKALTKTEVWICYDEKNIYVAAKCYDSLPDKDFIIQSLKRDFSYPRSDAFSVILDPVNDKTNGFSFAVNPFGAQREGLISNGGRHGVTTSWDNKWFSKVKQNQTYWAVEMAIPFKTIRYKANITEWGINFSRNNLKINESSAWSPIKRQFNIAALPSIGKLIFKEQPPKTGLNYSIIPYVSSAINKNFEANTKSENQIQFGGDAKIAVTPSLNLDVTINPDYSQVEVDRQVTNLSKFSISFPEQRRFFIENSDLFSGFGFRDLTPFFSRQVGARSGKQVPIIGGLRLTGKLNQKLRLGIMDIQTKDVDGIEPNNYNHFVTAIQKRVLKNSYFSTFIVNKQSFDNSIDSTNSRFNRVAGLEFNYISKNNQIKSKIFYHNSFNQNNPKKSRIHGLEFEYDTKNIYARMKHEYANKNYSSEVGFNPRLNIGRGLKKTFTSIRPLVIYKFYPESNCIIKHGPGLEHNTFLNSSSNLTEQYTELFYEVEFKNRSLIKAEYKVIKDSLFTDIDITRTGSTALPAGFYNFNIAELKYTSDERKTLFLIQEIKKGAFYNGKKITSETEIKYRYQPWGIFSLSYDYNKLNLPEPYFSGDIHLLGAKAELSFSKSVFFSTFFQFNTQNENVNINSRFQWRFRPMSDLFIVYTDNYDSVNFGQKNRGLIAKFVYWW